MPIQLLEHETRFANSAKKFFLMKCGIALSELKYTNSDNIHRRIGSHFNETVDKFDFGMDNADILKVDDDPAPREIAYPIIKEKIKQSKKADVSIDHRSCIFLTITHP